MQGFKGTQASCWQYLNVLGHQVQSSNLLSPPYSQGFCFPHLGVEVCSRRCCQTPLQ